MARDRNKMEAQNALQRQSRQSAGNAGSLLANLALLLRCSCVVLAPWCASPTGRCDEVQKQRENNARTMPRLPAGCPDCQQISEIAGGVLWN